MGKMESESRYRTKKGNLQRIILGTVAAAGFLSVALVAPNALKMFESFGIVPKRRHGEVIKNSRARLVKVGYLSYTPEGFIMLTPKGEARLKQLELAEYHFEKPKRWDKKWRVLIFDVKEERKGTREKIRRTLSSMGFVRLQDSVWVYPYDCEDLVTLLKADFRIGKELIYMIVDSIENDKWLRKCFTLPDMERR